MHCRGPGIGYLKQVLLGIQLSCQRFIFSQSPMFQESPARNREFSLTCFSKYMKEQVLRRVCLLVYVGRILLAEVLPRVIDCSYGIAKVVLLALHNSFHWFYKALVLRALSEWL